MLFSAPSWSEAAGTVSVTSRFDRAHHDSLAARKPDKVGVNINPRVLDALRRELRSGGLMSDAFDMIRDSPRLASGPFAAVWDDFSLSQTGQRFVLRFRESGDGPLCRFGLIPKNPGLHVESFHERGEAALAMSYVAYTRLRLAGRRGRDSVHGRAWLDHQWGDPRRLTAGRDGRRIKAWDWFSIQFANGEDWLLFVLKDAQTMSPLVRMLIARDARGRARRVKDFELAPVEWWLSPRTHVRYPVVWTLRVPGRAADLTFRPFAPDQEIPAYDVHRAVWEGAGEFSGTLGGRRVRGAARGEFHGYGYIFDARDYFKAQTRRVDLQIESFLPRLSEPSDLARLEPAVDPGIYADMLARPTWDLLSRGGKRWRPLFALYLLEALGVSPQPYEQLICALAELCHTGALIIDDIQDASEMRRGAPSIHLRYGLDAAVSAANTLYFLPALLIRDHPGLDERQRLTLHEIFIRQMARAHFGQAVDLAWSRDLNEDAIRKRPDGSRPGRILGMYGLKTGALLEGLAEMCAVVARADPSVREACRAFGRSLGIGFQILDDVHGYGRSSGWKKVRGEDIAQGKWTYVLAKAFATLPPRDRDRLAVLVGSKALRRRAAGREEAIGLVMRSGAPGVCRLEARAIVDAAWKRVRPRLRPSEARAMMALLYTDLMEMDFD
jgi:geranylgeranyl pyrophosphate synthase